MLSRASRIWFRFIHSKFLIYNISWEDVEIDLELLKLNSNSKVFTISSAGCNVLNYLLHSPQKITSVDINPRQTALLELKLTFIKSGDYEVYKEFFLEGRSNGYLEAYQNVKGKLSEASRQFWDTHIRYFNPSGNGLFLEGGSGYFARVLRSIIRNKELEDTVQALIREVDASERLSLFNEIDQVLFGNQAPAIWKTNGILSLAGIPETQRRALGDLNLFIREVVFNVFVKQHALQNPYWRCYLEGRIPEEYAPEHLKEESFLELRNQIEKLEVHSRSVFQHFQHTDEKYTHFILLDHMDWLVDQQQQELHTQWKLMIEKAEKNALFLFRTVHQNLDFIPLFVKEQVEFEQVDPSWLAENDRVGTYTGTYLGRLK